MTGEGATGERKAVMAGVERRGRGQDNYREGKLRLTDTKTGEQQPRMGNGVGRMVLGLHLGYLTIRTV